ncbi:UNVERIFIED_ORG: hypothetical protein CLV66_11954 [Actinomadura viridilutea]
MARMAVVSQAAPRPEAAGASRGLTTTPGDSRRDGRMP